MDVRLHFSNFINILRTFENSFSFKIRSNLLILDSHRDKSVESELSNADPSDNQNHNLLFTENINFNIINLLKHENKHSIIGNIDETSDLIYLSRHNVSKFEIINKQNKFFELFTLFENCIANSNLSPNELLKFNNKSEYEIFIRNLLDKKLQFQLFKEKEFLVFLKELLICLRLNQDKLLEEPFIVESFARDLEERMNLSFYHVRKRNYFEEDFELHKAVYENNLRMIRKICALETTSHLNCDINEVDSQGNTPLMLAIKLSNYDAINVLCDHDADIKHKSFEGEISPMEYAVSLQNKKIVKILINGVKKQKINNWESNKDEVLKIIKSIPDFSMDLKLNFDSNLFSLFSSITPNDFYKISKCGGNVRIDMNISAINSSFKSIKGRSSILIQEKGNKIDIFKIDHEKRISCDYIDYLTNIADEEKKTQQLLDEGILNQKIFTKNITLKKEKQKKEESIVNYVSEKYTAKGILYITKEKIKSNSLKLLQKESELKYKLSYALFSDYFQHGVEKRKLFIDIKSERKQNSVNDKKKKNKMASTGKIKEVNNNKGLNNFKTENNQSDSEYEIEYIETMKKKENVKIHKKPLEMSVWISDSFPVKVSHFIPLIHILSFISTEFADLKSALCSNFLPFQSFPLKISFPLGLSFYALLQVTSFSQAPPSLSVFEVNYESKSFKTASQNNFNILLDDNYAKDFYDKYYLEKKNEADSDFNSDSFLDEKIREVFLTNTEEDDPNKYKTEDIKSQISNGGNIQEPSIQIKNILIPKPSRKSKDILELSKILQEEIKGIPTGKKLQLDNNLNASSFIEKNEDLLDVDDRVPDEKEKFQHKHKIGFKIPFTPTPRRKEKINFSQFDNDSRSRKVSENKKLEKDYSQKTLKCSFKPSLKKNYKNFFKYESNINREYEQGEKKVNVPVQSIYLVKDNADGITEVQNKNDSQDQYKNHCIIF